MDEAVPAREAVPDLSDRDVTVAALGGRTLGARVVDPARMLARPIAPGRDGGGIMAEDWVPLLAGAFRLESRVKACTSGDLGRGYIGIGIQIRRYCTRSTSTGITADGNQWIKQVDLS